MCGKTCLYHSPQIRKITNLFKHTGLKNSIKNQEHYTSTYQTQEQQQNSKLQTKNLHTDM
jgi:hypothetical protein